MSLEKRRETKENDMERELEGSSFRRLDFTPLQDVKVKKKKKIKAREKPVTELSVIEKDVLNIAQEVLKLKRYDADFDIDVSSEAELQKFPIIERLYAKSIAKLAYRKGYSKEEIFFILKYRAQLSLKENVISDQIIKFISDLVMVNGDIRYGLNLIWKSSKIAENKDLKYITMDCVRLGNQEVVPLTTQDSLNYMTPPKLI